MTRARRRPTSLPRQSTILTNSNAYEQGLTGPNQGKRSLMKMNRMVCKMITKTMVSDPQGRVGKPMMFINIFEVGVCVKD